MSKSILHLDLHPIAKRSDKLDAALVDIMNEAEEKRVKAVEIITGKGTGQLKKRVLKFLYQKEVKSRSSV